MSEFHERAAVNISESSRRGWMIHARNFLSLARTLEQSAELARQALLPNVEKERAVSPRRYLIKVLVQQPPTTERRS